MKRWFCGIDAGGTSCRAAVFSPEGNAWGWGEGRGANPNHAGWEGAGAAMRGAVEAACAQAGTALGALHSIFLGMAGVISKEDHAEAGRICRNWGLSDSCRIGVDHDLRIGLQGGLSGRPGIVLIAGTGSSCYGRNAAGVSAQVGGWDRLLDDLGSGCDVGQRGMAAACQGADGRLAATVLTPLFFEALGVDNVIDFSVRVHRPGLARHEIAALAPLVLQAYRQGDAAAVSIVRAAALELARMAVAAAMRLFPNGDPEIVAVGGLFEKSPDYLREMQQAVHAQLPGARFSAMELRPALGAVSLAAEQANQPIPFSLLHELPIPSV